MPTVSVTFQTLRQMVASDLNDLITGTASGGSTTTLTATGEIARYPAGSLIGAELSTLSGTGSGQSRTITGHTITSGTVTLTVQTWTTVDNTTVYEIGRIQGRGFTRKQKEDAIYQAVYAVADYQWSDTDTVQLAIERGSGLTGTSTLGTGRREYPLPSGFNGIGGVDVLGHAPLTYWGTGQLSAFRALGDATARTRLDQGFQVPQNALVGYIAFYLAKVGTLTGTLTCVVETDTAGLPSGTAVANGTSATIAASTLQTRARYAVFTFDPPMLLSQNTQYHATLRRSDAVDASNYYQAGEDTAGGYSFGSLATRDATTWTAVSASDLVFAVSPPGTVWRDLGHNWEYRPQGTDQLLIKNLERWEDGRPIRIRGGAAISAPATETTEILCRPEYVVTVAKAILEANKAGRALPDNHAQAAGGFFRQLNIIPPPQRSYPPNYRRVY